MSNKKQNLNLRSVVKKIKQKETKQVSISMSIDLISKFEIQKGKWKSMDTLYI